MFCNILESSFTSIKLTPPKPPPKPKQLRQILLNKNQNTHSISNYENIPHNILNSKPILRQKSQQNRKKQIQNCRKAMIGSTNGPSSTYSNSVIPPRVPLQNSRSMDSVVAPTLISVENGIKNRETDIWSTSTSSNCSPPIPKPVLKKSAVLPRSWTPRRKSTISGTSFRQSKVIHSKRTIFFNSTTTNAPVASTNSGGGFFSRKVVSSWRRKKAVTPRKSSRQNSPQNLYLKNGLESDEDDKPLQAESKKSGKLFCQVVFEGYFLLIVVKYILLP